MASDHTLLERILLTHEGVRIQGRLYRSAELAALRQRVRDGRVTVTVDPGDISVVKVSVPGTEMSCFAYCSVS
jgi:hypothetical protein